MNPNRISHVQSDVKEANHSWFCLEFTKVSSQWLNPRLNWNPGTFPKSHHQSFHLCQSSFHSRHFCFQILHSQVPWDSQLPHRSPRLQRHCVRPWCPHVRYRETLRPCWSHVTQIDQALLPHFWTKLSFLASPRSEFRLSSRAGGMSLVVRHQILPLAPDMNTLLILTRISSGEVPVDQCTLLSYQMTEYLWHQYFMLWLPAKNEIKESYDILIGLLAFFMRQTDYKIELE